MMLTFLGDYILKATGKPYFAMSVLGGGTVLMNLLLNLLFIGVLRWGTVGAGLVTGLAFMTGFSVMIPVLFRKNSLVRVKRDAFSLKLLKEMAYNGSSEGLSELSAGVTVFLFNWVMMKTWDHIFRINLLVLL